MRLLYTIWCQFWLVAIFLLLFPLIFILLQSENWKPQVHILNRVWSKLFFLMIGIKCEIEYRFNPNINETYVFCANHFSYLDTASIAVIIKNYFAFIGRAETGKVPLFGYLFNKLHIGVNRDDAKSRIQTLKTTLKTLQSGRSIMIFPEGGINTKNAPQMFEPLTDGAFAMAIQAQVPIVPITLLTNYQILPDQNPMRFYRKTMKAIVHEPIFTKGLTKTDLDKVKTQYFDLVQNTLNLYQK